MNFVKRTTAPDPYDLHYVNVGFRVNGVSGYNRCIQGNPTRGAGRVWVGSVLPNCTGYAWGRFIECQGLKNCNLSTGHAKFWYGNTSDGYRRSNIPEVGAVACYSYGDSGHVCVVEEIYSNNRVLISESNWSGNTDHGYFNSRIINPTTYCGGTFQGYILPSTSFDGETLEWQAKEIGAYSRESNEAITNAKLIYGILDNLGFTFAAVCGVLGNIGHESGYNPWRWGSDIVLPINTNAGTDTGYGLFMYTPPSKYLQNSVAQSYSTFAPHGSNATGSPHDGDAQVLFMEYYCINLNGWIPRGGHNVSYSQYKTLNNVATAAEVWLYNFEYPANIVSEIPERVEEAQYWANVLAGYDPDYIPPEDGDGSGPKKGMPVWMMIGYDFY